MMNEVLEKLMYDAGLTADGCWNNMDKYDQEAIEKFAELIVNECAGVAARTAFPDSDEYVRKTFGHTWDMACVEASKDIRKHFGVE